MTDDSTPAPDPVRALAAYAVDELRTGECWRLLQSADYGRLAVIGPDGAPDIFPMNFVAKNECIYVRSGPGSKLVDIVRNREVAYETDGRNGDFTWSVVVRGKAARMDADDEIEASGLLDLRTATPTGKDNFIRITPSTVTGRQFRSRRSA